MATVLEIAFLTKVDELLALRDKQQAGETLTNQQYTELALYRDLLNEYIENKSVDLARDLQATQTLRLQKEFAVQAALFTALTSGNEPRVPTETVEQKTPEKPVLVETPIDPTNVNKTIRDIQTAGKDVESGTKTQEYSKQEGIFNEFSNAVTFIETIKSTVAQTFENTLTAVTEPVPFIVNQDAGVVLSSIEILKADVSQLLQTGEIQIQRTVELNIFTSNVYAADQETGIRARSFKQDTLDPQVQLILTAQNPYTVTQAQLASEGLILANEQEIASIINTFEQQQLFEEQSAAVESFTGGG